ncbi:MAG: helix-turn-helix domain-containing protein [Chloroflexota bacterium]|nr:helix-turn-helix domain-containing protein [Chloroflexota bacterium]
MEITVDDLLALAPGLVSRKPVCLVTDGAESCNERSVTWAVTARTSPPHIPLLRGGEVLLIPARVTQEVEENLPAILREAARREVSAVIFAEDDELAKQSYAHVQDIPILYWRGDLSLDKETEINRLLTECRGNLYRIGTELERRMTDAAAGDAGVEALARVVTHSSGLSLKVIDALGRQLAPQAANGDIESGVDSGNGPGQVCRGLPSGAKVILGPVRPEQRVLARFVIDRIANAATAALQRDNASRPRGSRRNEATAALLSSRNLTASDQRAAALALGLDPDAVFFVAISKHATEPELARALAALGTLHPAGGARQQLTTLLVAHGRPGAESLASRVLEVKKRWERDHATDDATLAVSAPAFGVARIPGAASEADFVASLQSQAEFSRRAASFESLDDVGAMRLLYQLRDSNELRQFISEALGTLENRDQRGTLRATLRAFLESGGSQVDASHRLGIHRNTLAYRLRRIGELVGRDVGDPGSWLTLHLALRASEMLELAAQDR